VPRSEALDTPHGRCVILELDEQDDLPPLVGGEHALAERLGPTRRRELAAGRAALRAALGIEAAILPDDRGAPQLPAGWVGSISHKGFRASAIVAPSGAGFVGVDIEVAAPPRMPIEKRILTVAEQRRISDPRDVTLHFSIKEAIYKAVDPIVRRYVGFTGVELEIAVNGSVAVRIVDPSKLPVHVEAWWQERNGVWLATARGTPR